jgi:broad specificity phosphatase PhoE
MTKILYCIRHGRAMHNILYKTMGSQAYYKFRDTPLTNEGLLDAINLNKVWKEKNKIELIVVSPLSRTLRTCDIIFKNSNIPVTVLDELKEYPQSGQIVNHRQNKTILKKLYPEFDFSNIISNKDCNWSEKELSKNLNIERLTNQITEFKKWIKRRPENNIAVVGHSSYLNMMINGFVDNETTELKHCYPYLYKL